MKEYKQFLNITGIFLTVRTYTAPTTTAQEIIKRNLQHYPPNEEQQVFSSFIYRNIQEYRHVKNNLSVLYREKYSTFYLKILLFFFSEVNLKRQL